MKLYRSSPAQITGTPYDRPDSQVPLGDAFKAIPLPPLQGSKAEISQAEDIRWQTWRVAFTYGVSAQKWAELLNGKGLSAQWWIANRPKHPNYNEMRTALENL